MRPGDAVTWPGGDTARVGVLVAHVEANAEPVLPAGVSRYRARFRPGLCLHARYLCRDERGLYYAPRVESVTASTAPST